MTRLTLAAVALVALAVAAFVMELRSIAAGLGVTPTPVPMPAPEDDSEVVGPDPVTIRWGGSALYATTRTSIPSGSGIDWDGILSGSVIPIETRRN